MADTNNEFNINGFRSQILSKGVQVASHFDLEMNFPPETGGGDKKTLRLRCESVSLPDLSINTIETHRFGFGTPDIVPYGLSYFETVVTFIGDQEGFVYKQFYDWINKILQMPQNPTAKSGLMTQEAQSQRIYDYEVGFKADIVVDEAKIHAYDQRHQKIYTVSLFDVFPRSLTTTSLNWAAGDEMVRYTAFLSFKDFKIDFNKLNS